MLRTFGLHAPRTPHSRAQHAPLRHPQAFRELLWRLSEMMLSSRDTIDTVHPAIPHLQPRREALSSCNGLPCASVCTDLAPALTASCSCGDLGNTKCRQLRFHCDRGDLGETMLIVSGGSSVRRTVPSYPRARKLRMPYRCLLGTPPPKRAFARLRCSAAAEGNWESHEFQKFGRSPSTSSEGKLRNTRRRLGTRPTCRSAACAARRTSRMTFRPCS